MDEEFKLGGNGHPENAGDVETQEQLKAVKLKLSDFSGREGQIITMTKEQLSLLKQFIHPPDAEDKFIQMSMMLDFENEEERRNVVAAYYEAGRLGMDTNWNLADALTRCSTNRKGGHRNSRVAMIGEWLSHVKYTSNTEKGAYGRGGNPRSPIS